MTRLIRTLLAAAAMTLAAVPSFAQQKYHANDITPAGSTAGKLNGASNGRQVGAKQVSGISHAVVMTGNALASVDLHPASFYMSAALASDDFQQGGWGYSMVGQIHALVWNGSSSSFADLNPSGYNFSYCLGVHNGQQVGFAEQQSYFVTASHAMLWNGSAASATDLHPAVFAFPYSRALGVHDGEQVGYVSSLAYPVGEYQGSTHSSSRAYRWNGSAATAVDLHPAGFASSEASATNGLQQGGWASLPLPSGAAHAMLWNGTADSAMDLHPAGYTETRITAMTPTMQVGEGWVGTPGMVGSVRHALAWTGTADSVIDLNQFVPAGYTHAVATGVDANGNVVGFAYNQTFYGLTIPADAIAVVFAPGPASPAELASIDLVATDVRPGDVLNGTVTLAGAAPAGGVTVSFLSANESAIATPVSVTIAEGETTAPFSTTVPGALLTPQVIKLYATDGSVSRATSVTVTPVVHVRAINVNAVEGGFQTFGTLTLNIPAQLGGAALSLTASDPSLVVVPASVVVPFGSQVISFPINTASVAASTPVTVTADLNGEIVSATLTLSAAPVVSVSAVSAPAVVGGMPVTVSVSVTNFPRGAAGATISLVSSDPSIVQVPATITVPQYAYGAAFVATTSIIKGSGIVPVTITATYNDSLIVGTVAVNPVPTVTITQADYLTDTMMLKVTASTSFENSLLTYGTDVSGGPIGTMQFELGVFKGSILLPSAPKTVTVWNSNGGSATFNVTVKTPKTSGGGGGGTSTGGGGSTSTDTTTSTKSVKLTIKTAGKGTVSQSIAGTSFAAGTTITLTAKADVGAVFTGWAGACTGTSTTCTITLKADTSVTANFK